MARRAAVDRLRSGLSQPLLSRFTVTGIQYLLAGYCREIGTWITCHQLRHTFANDLLTADIPVTTIQKLLGHASLTTTQLYVAANDRQVKRDFFTAVANLESWQ